MKKTITLAVAFATLFAFTSCQKENLENNSTVNGSRIITAEFENTATKTTLNEDGITPEWAVDDVIRVLNATGYEDIQLTTEKIENEGKSITFTTGLTGTLYAVYPASATTMESCGDGNISFTIPAIQDGSFASANICVAKSSTTDETNKDNLVFRNATAVLEFNQTAAETKVLSIRVEAANAIVGPMSVSFKADGTLDDPTTSSLTGNLINAKSTEAKDRYYVAVAPVATGRIEFEYQKAVEVATVTTEEGKTLAANIIYACPSMDGETYEVKKGSINGHDYVQIGSLKWATMNIGATTVTGETSYGDYFMWGAVVKAYTSLSGTTFEFGDNAPSSYTNSTWDKTKGFAWENCNFTDGKYSRSTKNVFTKYTAGEVAYAKSGTADGKTVLEAVDDAAAQIWGSTWRMPTGGTTGEFKALYDATKWTWDSTDKGYYVTKKDEALSADKSNALLFFPAAGYGYYTDLYDVGECGSYWSSSLNTGGDPGRAYGLYFVDGDALTENTTDVRCNGLSVRAVSE